MRILLLPALLFNLCTNAEQLTSVQADSLALVAEAAYIKGDHQQALAYYAQVNEQYTSAALLLNIGNCHFKLGNIPQAILHYERALRADPGSEDAYANLELAREQVVDRIQPMPSFALGEFWSKLRSGGDPDAWALRSVWGLCGLFAVLSLLLFRAFRKGRVLLFTAAGLLGMVALISLGFAASRHAELMDRSAAVIVEPRIEVRSEPRDGATVLFVLHQGTKLVILQERDTWIEVRLPNGSVGWTPSTMLERI